MNKQKYGGNRKSIWCVLIFKHKGNFKLGNLFHSHLRGQELQCWGPYVLSEFFSLPILKKGHQGGSPPSAGLLRRPPTGSATTAGVARIRHSVRTRTVPASAGQAPATAGQVVVAHVESHARIPDDGDHSGDHRQGLRPLPGLPGSDTGELKAGRTLASALYHHTSIIASSYKNHTRIIEGRWEEHASNGALWSLRKCLVRVS